MHWLPRHLAGTGPVTIAPRSGPVCPGSTFVILIDRRLRWDHTAVKSRAPRNAGRGLAAANGATHVFSTLL